MTTYLVMITLAGKVQEPIRCNCIDEVHDVIFKTFPQYDDGLPTIKGIQAMLRITDPDTYFIINEID